MKIWVDYSQESVWLDKWRGGACKTRWVSAKTGRKGGFWGETAAQQEEMVNQVGQAAASQTLA